MIYRHPSICQNRRVLFLCNDPDGVDVRPRMEKWTACAPNVRQDAGGYDLKSAKKLRKPPYSIRNTAVFMVAETGLEPATSGL